MKNGALTAIAGFALLGVLGCEPRDPADPAVDPSPVEDPDAGGPPATTRAASQPPAVPLSELVDTVPDATEPDEQR
jgi:hypothetical protein